MREVGQLDGENLIDAEFAPMRKVAAASPVDPAPAVPSGHIRVLFPAKAYSQPSVVHDLPVRGALALRFYVKQLGLMSRYLRGRAVNGKGRPVTLSYVTKAGETITVRFADGAMSR